MDVSGTVSAKLVPEWVAVNINGAPVEFLCNPLNSVQKLNCYGLMSADRLGDAFLEACLYAVKDWRGPPGEFSRGALKEYLSSIESEGVLSELANRVLTRTRLSEIERKN
jgi:hypothetical protein